MTKRDKQSLKSVAAIAVTLFYIVNVQSVHKEVPKQLARQDELEMVISNERTQNKRSQAKVLRQ